MRQSEFKLGLQRHAFSTPSWAISRVSIATSLPVALKVGPTHLIGQASRKFQRVFSSPASLIRMMEPFFRSILPSMHFFRQSHSEASSVEPHFRVILETLYSSGSFRGVSGFSLPSRYTISSCELSSPETSRNPPRSIPSISILKL